jgi:hypothetical protein
MDALDPSDGILPILRNEIFLRETPPADPRQ